MNVFWKFWPLFLLVAVGIGVLYGVKMLLQEAARRKRADLAQAGYPFERKSLLSAGEKAFYRVLCECLNGQYLIFAKVKLADLIDVRKGTEDRNSHFGRISQKHVDFVLCDKKSVEPVLVIELDDKSHGWAGRKKGDDTKNKVLEAAGVPLLRVRQREKYSTRELLEAIVGEIEK